MVRKWRHRRIRQVMGLPVVMVPELMLLVLKVLPVLGVSLKVSVHLLHVQRPGCRLLPVWRHPDPGPGLRNDGDQGGGQGGQGRGEPVILGSGEVGEGGGRVRAGAWGGGGLHIVTIEYLLHEAVESLTSL